MDSPKPKRRAKRIGRPTKLTPALREQIAGLIRVGNYAGTAARAVGIGESTFYRWLERGDAFEGERARVEALDRRALVREARRQGVAVRPRMRRETLVAAVLAAEEPYWDFREAVKRAEAEAESAAMVYVQQAMPSHWQAAAWYLERRYPDRYGRRVISTEVSGPQGGPITVRLSRMTDEELDRAHARLVGASGEGGEGEGVPPRG